MKKKDPLDGVKRLAEKQIITEKRFVRRFLPVGTVITPAAKTLAKLIAEDANTALYVIEYNKGNFSAREDYIEYLADRIQYLINGGKP